jgi:hypothetical protein
VTRTPRTLVAAVVLVPLVSLAIGCGDDDDTAEGGGAGDVSGTLEVDAGTCEDGGVTGGSFFRMVQPGGTPDEGPFVVNGDSPCGDSTWTPLTPGEAGGLTLGEFQTQPDPPFGATGDGQAAQILAPQRWFAVNFAVATNEVDPQTGSQVGPPTLTLSDGALTGDLRAWGVAWNGQHFNQGSPKPDGSMPGTTSPVTGTLDEGGGAFVLEWTSQIVGGPFNNFTGIWHLEGTLEGAG